MALTKFGRETHKTTTHNGQDSANAVCSWRTESLISCHFATKRYTQDEDDGEEDAFLDAYGGG